MGHWFYRNIVEPGKLPLLLALTAFVLTFLITRVITRLIRAGKGPFGNVEAAGGLHIHHVVPGVILTVIGGFGAVAGGGRGFGPALSAVVFGIGAGLVLDEFALILHLNDVYWSEAGRQSVEVVVITAALVGLVLVGFAPFGVNDLSQEEMQDRGTAIATVSVNFLFALIALSKGKTRTAVFGAIIPAFALIGAIRLARPDSPWSRRFYTHRPRARARATLRAYHHDRRWSRPRRALEDWLGGKPNSPPQHPPDTSPGADPNTRPRAGSNTLTAADTNAPPGAAPDAVPGAAPDALSDAAPDASPGRDADVPPGTGPNALPGAAEDVPPGADEDSRPESGTDARPRPPAGGRS